MTEKDKLLSETSDSCRADPGEITGRVFCGVCGGETEARRSVYGPTCYAQSVSRSGSLHDSFSCPHREEDWHLQAKKLREMARDTPSAKLQQLFREEAEEIIESRKATKEVTWLS